jgi:hypothetical protein
MESFAIRLDQHAERHDQAMERIGARFDRMDEKLSEIYEIVTRKKAGFAR